ncbi:MAG: LysM peptidoglycan-binding domain-containing protein, partial [Candidatus Colwellbacteria bacterium]|nr:LysM peptidoglycan-binding domain-containing protein [Candidatus Colwellbacteria bacterium]
MVPPLPVVLVLSVVGANLFYINQILPAELPKDALIEGASASEFDNTALINDANLAGLTAADSPEDTVGYVLVDRSSFLNPSTLSTNITPSRNGLLIYKVADGDTVSTIAAQFGISVSTIIWANNLGASGRIKPGEEVIILPVSGVLHKVMRGETIASIASAYGVEAKNIATFNREALKAGETVVVPNARPINPAKPRTSRSSSRSNSPETASRGYFISPLTNGLNWGRLHDG